jgi:ketosteroid isomerase-like protein
MTTTTTSTVDMTDLKTAIESRDAAGVASWYTEDATLTILDRDHPPAAPSVITGRKAIYEYYRDVCGRNITHAVRDLVSTDDGVAFTQHCRYPDGGGVVCVTVARFTAGKISAQTAVQVWD